LNNKAVFEMSREPLSVNNSISCIRITDRAPKNVDKIINEISISENLIFRIKKI